MQKMSQAYKKAMKEPLRNRAYAKVYIGIFNSEATSSVYVNKSQNSFEYYTDANNITKASEIKEYATCENNFAKLDGSQYFIPPSGGSYDYYNNGLVTTYGTGNIRIDFNTHNLDIKGLTLDLGENYPQTLKIEWDNGSVTHTLNDRYLVTSDIYSGVSYFKFTASNFVHSTNGRFRIYSIMFGQGLSFTNELIESISCSDYVSSITDSIPSRDMTVNLLNKDNQFSPDNPDSSLAFFEIGQDIKVNYGMTLEDGTIEWTPIRTAFLKSWSANEQIANIVATDRFDGMNSLYTKGTKGSITLYDLAIKVLTDMGVTSDGYFISEYLKSITVENPLPPVRHTEALQIIANAGRCVMYEDKDNRIHIEPSFIAVPNVTAIYYDTDHSHLNTVLINDPNVYIPYHSFNGSMLDGSTEFADSSNINSSFVTNVSDAWGEFTGLPTLNFYFETKFSCNSMVITFNGEPPTVFSMFLDDKPAIVINNPTRQRVIEYTTPIEDVKIISLRFSKTYHPNSRILVESVNFGAYADYSLTYDRELTASPLARREKKLKSLRVAKTNFLNGTASKTIKEDTMFLKKGTHTFNVEFGEPCYGISASILKGNASIRIDKTYTYSCDITITVTADSTVSFRISGTEYVQDVAYYTELFPNTGEEIEWKNPLISTEDHAQKVAEWLDDYYMGDVSYNIKWRGDPRTEANDLFLLELKDREPTIIRAYKNTLNYNGAFSGELEARKAVI